MYIGLNNIIEANYHYIYNVTDNVGLVLLNNLAHAAVVSKLVLQVDLTYGTQHVSAAEACSLTLSLI